MNYMVYLSGEIHTDWRERIITAVEQLGLNISFSCWRRRSGGHGALCPPAELAARKVDPLMLEQLYATNT